VKEGGDPIEKTVCSHAFIAYRSGIRLYRLREEARAEAGPGPGSSAAASGARTRARTRARACTRACEAGKEVMYRGIYQLTTSCGPRQGAFSLVKNVMREPARCRMPVIDPTLLTTF
jgi:hypothetical protein